ncbi:MAG: hypothetical protein ACK5Z5_02410 [Neisseriaceae bacterium]
MIHGSHLYFSGLATARAKDTSTDLEIKLKQLEKGIFSNLGKSAKISIKAADFKSYLKDSLAFSKNTTINSIKSQLEQKISAMIEKKCDTTAKLNAFRLLIKAIQEGVNADGNYNKLFGKINSESDLQNYYDGGIDKDFFNEISSDDFYKDIRIELAIICSHQKGLLPFTPPTTRFSFTGGTNYTNTAEKLRKLINKKQIKLNTISISTPDFTSIHKKNDNLEKNYEYNSSVTREINSSGNIEYKLDGVTYTTRGKFAPSDRNIGKGNVGEVKSQRLPYKNLTATKKFSTEHKYHPRMNVYFNRMIKSVRDLGIQERVIPPLYLKAKSQTNSGEISYKSVAPLIIKVKDANDRIKDIPNSAFRQAADDIWQLQKLGFKMSDAHLGNYLYNSERKHLIRIDLDNDMLLKRDEVVTDDGIDNEPVEKNISRAQAYNFWLFVRDIARVRSEKYPNIFNSLGHALNGIVKDEYIQKFFVRQNIDELVLWASTNNYSDLFLE